MHLPTPHSALRFRPRASFAAACAALVLAGCAQLPKTGAAPAPREAGSFETRASFEAPAVDWPQDRWWQRYGDPQLDALVEEALRGAPTLAAAAARLQQAQAMTQVARSATLPRIDGNAGFTQEKLSENHLTPPALTPQGWNDYGRATLDFRWELDFWGRNRAGLAAATSQRDAAQAEFAQARLLLASGIASSYAELARLHAGRETAARSLELRRHTADLFAKRFEHGLETRGTVRAADARRAAAEGALLALDERIALQRHRIAALLGAGPDRGRALEAPALRLDRAWGLPPQLAADLIGRRPDLVAARLQVQAQDSRIAQKKADFYPNVNLTAFLGVQALGLDMLARGGSGVGGVGPAISLPIFSAGRLQGELRGAQARHAEAVANYDATLAQALREVADAAVSQRALGERLAKAQEAVDAATEAHRQAADRYTGGLATYLEVLAAEDTLLASREALTDLRAASFTLDVALQRALGGGYQAAA